MSCSRRDRAPYFFFLHSLAAESPRTDRRMPSVDAKDIFCRKSFSYGEWRGPERNAVRGLRGIEVEESDEGTFTDIAYVSDLRLARAVRLRIPESVALPKQGQARRIYVVGGESIWGSR